MVFAYPLKLTFKTKEEHAAHVKENFQFYNETLKVINVELVAALEEEKKAKSQLEKQSENEKLEKAKLAQELAEKKKIIVQQEKEHSLENKKLTEKLEITNNKLVENRQKAEQLWKKRKKYENVESSAKGKTFEEEIKYVLNEQKQNFNFECWIEDTGKIHACDIRIHIQDLGMIGVEAKDKKIITKQDVDKFNRDRVKNNFIGSVFWSKHSKIPGYPDTRGVEGEGFLNLDENNCLFVCGDDYMRIGQIIFVYVSFLRALKKNPGDSSEFSDLITRMFSMMLVHYESFGKLKKEVQNVDKMLYNDLETINYLCKKHDIKQKPFAGKDTDLFLVRKRDFGFGVPSFYKNKELEAEKQPNMHKFAGKKSESFFCPQKRNSTTTTFGDYETSPKKSSKGNLNLNVNTAKSHSTETIRLDDCIKTEFSNLESSPNKAVLHNTTGGNEIKEDASTKQPRNLPLFPPIIFVDDEEDEENTFDTASGDDSFSSAKGKAFEPSQIY